MNIEKTNGYGIAISDLEGNWDKSFKSKLKKISQKIIFENLSFFEKIRLMFEFSNQNKIAKKLDLSEIKAKGLKNEEFIKQQLEYIAMFAALTKIIGTDKTLKIMYDVMSQTSVKAFSQNSPEDTAIKEFGNNFEFFRKYFEPLPTVCLKAGCLDMRLIENNQNSFQFDIYYCAWLELAKKMNIPDACKPNCYADDHAYPDYFKKYGIKYSRKGTLANGAKCCDLRFEKIES